MACYFIQPWLALRASIALLLVLFTCKSQSDLANHIISFTATDSTAPGSSIQKRNGFFCLKKDNSQHFCSLTGLPSKNTTPTFVRVQSSSLLTVNINNDSKDPGRLLINNDEIVVVSLNEQPETIELKLRDKIKHLPESQTDSGNSYCQTIPEQEDILSCYMYPGDTVRIKTPAELLLGNKTRYSDAYAELTTGEPKDASHQTFPPDDFTNGSFLVLNTRKTTPSSEEQKPLHSPDTFITALVTAKMQLLLEMTGNNLHHRGRYTTVPDSFNQELLLSPKTKFPAYDLSVKPDKSYTTVITYMFGSSFKKPGYYGYCDDDLAHLIIGFRRQYDEGRIWLALLDGVTFQEYLFDQLSQGAYSQYPRDYLLYCLSFLETRPASGTNPPHIQHCTYGQYPSNIACAIVTAPNSRAGSGQTLLQSSKPLARKAGNEKLPVKNRQLFTKRQQTAQTPGTPDKKRRRGKFTPEQKRILESAFKENNYLPPKGQQRIAAKAKMTTIQVRDWFQNRRKEEKKKMNSSLATTLQQYFHTPVNSINVAGIAGIAGIAGSSFAQVLARSYQQLPPLVLASAPDSGAQGYNSPFAYPLQTITNNDNPASGPLFSEPSSSESKDEGEQNQPGSSLTQPDLTMDGEPVEMERNEEGYVHFKRIKKN